jgi:hypothetical protein
MVKTKNNTKQTKNSESSSHPPLVEQEITTVNVLGCCLSRDIFNVDLGEKYKVEGYVFGINPFMIFNESPSEYHVDDTDIAILDIPHPFRERVLKQMLNGGASEYLIKRKGDWIIIDTHYAYGKLCTLTYPDGQQLLFQGNHLYLGTIISTNDKFKECSFQHIDGTINLSYYINELANFLRTNWGDKIILIDGMESGYRYDENELITQTDVQNHSKSHSNRMAELLVDQLGCNYIKMPFIPIKYDDIGVHYILEVRMYLKETVDAIISEHKTDHTRDMIDIKYNGKISNIQMGESLSLSTTINKIKKIFLDNNEEKYIWALNELKKISQYGNAMGLLGRAYRDGKGIEKNLDIAAEWMRKAVAKNIGWANNELFDVLWRIGTAESFDEAAAVAKSRSEAGDGNAMGRLGRAYRDGKGVPQDLNIAAEWMRKAANIDIKWINEFSAIQEISRMN